MTITFKQPEKMIPWSFGKVALWVAFSATVWAGIYTYIF